MMFMICMIWLLVSELCSGWMMGIVFVVVVL